MATIEQMKKRKIEMETDITKMLQDFESEYGVRVGYFEIMRKRIKHKKGANDPESVMFDAPTQDIETINIDMRFED